MDNIRWLTLEHFRGLEGNFVGESSSQKNNLVIWLKKPKTLTLSSTSLRKHISHSGSVLDEFSNYALFCMHDEDLLYWPARVGSERAHAGWIILWRLMNQTPGDTTNHGEEIWTNGGLCNSNWFYPILQSAMTYFMARGIESCTTEWRSTWISVQTNVI